MQTIDATLSDANDSLNIVSTVNDIVGNGSRNVSFDSKQRNQLPTAVVKPKHKKPSFDDRQLPIILDVNREQPWFDKNNALTESQPLKAIIHESKQKPNSLQIERKYKKHRIESAHLSSSKNDIGNCDGDNNNVKSRPKEHTKSKELRNKKNSSVAVIHPRRKEKMDEKKLMETIVQMQIKKNSMDNRNNNRKGTNAVKSEVSKNTFDINKTSPKESPGN